MCWCSCRWGGTRRVGSGWHSPCCSWRSTLASLWACVEAQGTQGCCRFAFPLKSKCIACRMPCHPPLDDLYCLYRLLRATTRATGSGCPTAPPPAPRPPCPSSSPTSAPPTESTSGSKPPTAPPPPPASRSTGSRSRTSRQAARHGRTPTSGRRRSGRGATTRTSPGPSCLPTRWSWCNYQTSQA